MDDGYKNSTSEADDASVADHSIGVNSGAIIAVKSISILLIIVLICGLNFLVSYTLYKKSYLQNPGNRYVFAMAISNFIFGAVVLPLNFVSCVYGEWIFGIMMCNLTGVITMTVFAGSMLSIVVITIDRYYAILQPMLYPSKVTCSRTKELIIAIWILSLFGSLPPLFGWSRYTWLDSTSNCIVQWDISPSFAYTFTVVFLIIPLSILFVCYGRILKVARLSSRRTSNGNIVMPIEYKPTLRRRSRRTSLLDNIRMNSPTKAIRTVIITLSALLFTIGPLLILLIYQTIRGVAHIPVPVMITATWLFFCSFIANSCIYAVWNKGIRKELLGYFCARGRCMDDDDTSLFQPARKNSQAISVSGSVSDLNGFTVAKPSNILSQGIQDTSTIDSGTVLTCIEESEDTETLLLSESHRCTARRTASPGHNSRLSQKEEIQPTLLVVSEVHLPETVLEEDVYNPLSKTEKT